jgi:hypothetical protein
VSKKLVAAAAEDYPEASKINVSFPDKWKLVHPFTRGDTPLYVAAFPISNERARADHFYGLPAEINKSLTKYRHYRLFLPWPTPIIPVVWDTQAGAGQVVEGGRLEVQLRPLGQAQVWFGEVYGLLWECYLSEGSRQPETWQQELVTFWQAVEQDMGVNKIFTQPLEPTFDEGYPEFLSSLGYAPDPGFERWWSKYV